MLSRTESMDTGGKAVSFLLTVHSAVSRNVHT